MTAPTIIVATLTRDEIDIATRPVNGNGGHQGLLRKMLPRLNRRTGRMQILPQHLETARRYAADYGVGGYQDRFIAICAAADRRLAELGA